jgi:DNA-binding PadR family transcriptional regulator
MDIRTLCLGILSLGDATGYEINKMVAEGSFSFFSQASFGSIYPALTKLTDEGLVTCRAEPQQKRPDKKIYSLTAVGRERLTQELKRSPGPDRNRSDFLAAVLFAEAVSPARIQDLIDDRIYEHRHKITTLEALLEEDMSEGSRFVVEYGVAMQRTALEYLQKNRHIFGRDQKEPDRHGDDASLAT